LSSVSADKLSITRNKALFNAARPDIAKVYRTRGSFGKPAALGGAVIGAGSGATIGAIAGNSCNGEGWCFFPKRDTAIALAIVGAGLGALAGLIVGGLRHKKTMVYDGR
jgi:hypothetical protein